LRRLAAVLGLLVLVALAALAQEATDTEGDNGFLVNLLENRLSTPGRQIRLHGISGALSSQARIDRITVSDARGVWLEIDNVEIDWSRLALLRGRVNVNRLSAERVAWLRRGETPPAAGPALPQAEAEPFSLPELPVAIELRELAFPSIVFAEPVFGQPAELSLAGRLTLRSGVLDTTLDVDRKDPPGGTLDLVASFSNATRELAVDLDLHEPQGGIVATLLNIEGAPAIDLTAQGSGPLDQVEVTFALDADQRRIASGVVALRARDEGLGFDVDLGGELAPLVPAPYRDFFAGRSTVQVRGVSKTGGGLRIDEIDVAGAELALDGSLETGSDGFLRSLNLTGSLGDPAGPPVVLPVPGGDTRLQSAVLHVNFGGSSRWNGLVVLDRLDAGGIAMEDVTLRLGGLALNLDDPARRNVTVQAEGLATGLWSEDPDVARALGSRLDLFADAALEPGGAVALRQFQVSSNGLSIFTAGSFDDLVYSGRSAIRVADLAAFSGLAGRELSGAVDLRAEGSVTPLSGAFDLTLDGGTTDLGLGDPRLDRLLAGETTVAGRAVRDATGLRTEDLRIENPQLSFASNGLISSTRTDIGFDAALSDLGLVDPRLGGRLEAQGTARGQGTPIAVSVSAAIPEGRIEERTLTDARLGFEGVVDGRNVTGSLSGGGELDGLPIDLAGQVAITGQSLSVSGLEFVVGPNRLTGDLAQQGSAPVTGRLALAAPDIAPLAALALVEATGALDATITLEAAETGQGVGLDLRARDLAVAGNRVAALDAQAQIADALGVPLVDGTLEASELALGGVEVASLRATADQTDPDAMRFDADARLAIGTLADLSGDLRRLDDGFAAQLDTLSLRQQGVAATLAAPATVTLRGGAVELTPLRLDIGRGTLTAQGRVDERFDIEVAATALPLDIANIVQPALELAGEVSGTARVVGPRDAPDVTFDVAAAGLASSITRGAGLPPVTLDARGRTEGGRLNLTATVGSGTGLAARAQGRIPLNAGALDLGVELQAFPLAYLDRLAGSRGLRGTVTGRAHAGGTLADPTVTFDLRGEGVTADLLAANTVPPLTIAAAGSYRRQAVQLDSARISGAGGIDLQGSGRIPLQGPGLDARVSGTAPLALLNPFLEDRAAQATGTVRISATARGSLANPQLSGEVSLQGGGFTDPQTNVRLQNISLDAGLEGNAVVLRSLRAEVASGGVVTAEGRVSLAAGYPADLSVRLDDIRYTDGAFVSTRFSGALTMNGPLVGGGGLLAGEINLERTEILVAEALGGSGQAALEQVEHVRTPPAVQQTLDRARVDASRAAREGQAGPGIGLDVRIRAPNQIFVRGRGLDVELGGDLRLRGTTTDLQPVGGFELRRGRLVILGQRIEFDEGQLQLVGNLDPLINFVAETTSGDVTAIVTVTGRVSSPQITFSSEPPLPQDEVLARILFNRATQDLSPFQIAQLAAAAAELAGGGGGPGILSQLRSATGLDDLDIITDESGQAAVRAGRYLDENIYVTVQTDVDGGARAEITLELSDRVSARGSVGSDGNSTIGIFYERDY
jgi:translocation and assembly module TamB